MLLFGFVTSISFFPRMPNNMEYKISDTASFKGAASGNQRTSKLDLWFAVHKLCAFGKIAVRRQLGHRVLLLSGRAVNVSFWNKINSDQMISNFCQNI